MLPLTQIIIFRWPFKHVDFFFFFYLHCFSSSNLFPFNGDPIDRKAYNREPSHDWRDISSVNRKQLQRQNLSFSQLSYLFPLLSFYLVLAVLKNLNASDSFHSAFWAAKRKRSPASLRGRVSFPPEQNLVIQVNETRGGTRKKPMTHVGKQFLRDDVLVQGRHTDRGQITTSLKLKHSPSPWRK